MQRAVTGFVVLLLAFAAYRAWHNTQADPALEARAHTVACQELARCSAAEARPSSVSRNPFRHVYTFETSAGRVEVTCRWGMVILGSASCHGEMHEVTAIDPHAPDQLPHQVGRGTP